MKPELGELNPPARILLGPGPSNVDSRVYRAMMAPVLGHLDPEFIHIMDDTQVLMRYLFDTQNRLTFPVSGTGSAGMDTAMLNLLEPGDTAAITVTGFFGARLADMAARAGAEVIELKAEPGLPADPEQARATLRGKKVKVLAVTHGETSTGVMHDLDAFRQVADDCGALLVVDAVATAGGMPLRVDAQKLDLCFTGSQKCLSAPPGLAPLTAGPQVEETIRRRKTRVPSWYFDLTYIMNYWGAERTYHHTAPISMVYALREALRLVAEEGLEARWERHRRNQQALVAGLEAMGLEMLAAPEQRMWTVNAVKVPAGVEDKRVRGRLMEEFNIEIAGGLGTLKGRIWRIGLMGTSCTETNVLLLLGALEKILSEEGCKLSPGAGVAAAAQAYQRAPAPAATD
ncbi:MAG TPA: alanine--glyoxylate aminotransferase family protein [Candidatus Acidoferrales bacterium]|nr:alanine--glyoxylate aminotransferase family protein [Candidatus Acidoferrales bacterium]